MNIRILATGSSGNCYIIDDGSTYLMIECGIPMRQILKARVAVPRHCLVSHEHGDHSKAINDMRRHGIAIYASSGTLKALRTEDGIALKHKHPIAIKTLTVMPLNAEHDAEEPLMFYIISSVTNERLLYASDTRSIPYRFRPITHLMIEVNHDEELMEQNLIMGRILKNHFSLQDAVSYISTLDKSMLQVIYLIHPSKDNLDLQIAKRRLQEASGVIVLTE